uniref:Demethylepipodophyllotoxin synthase n=1 Tax=Sinopodophyllum hexandrum TaxID=93608 RepID=C82D6_SINHE|nr:RecName: Full=Demethylepipodophyllotoxin synthase; AltName: Full=Cytochrome P450 family 82 subfamily D polypeptide 61 [Sinopodophyllum hexandrum]ALG05144.1 cytochrome P450 family 82 subfamily D polypeptide 61 [Sinopodophyllum hexandrum]
MDSLHCLETLLLGFFVLLPCFFYFVWKKPNNKIKEPPQPAGAWPIIGHLHLLARGDLPHKILSSFADKNGPVFKIQLGVHQALVVNNSEIAKECFTTNDRFFLNRPSGVAAKIMGYNYVMLGVAPYGPYWRDMRKIIMLEFLSNRRLQSLKHVWHSEISISSKELYKLWETQNIDFCLVDMKQWLADLTLNMSVKMVVGKRFFGSASASACEETESSNCPKTLRNMFRLMGSFVLSDYLPYLRWLDLGGHEKEMKRTVKELDILFKGWLDEHKRKRLSGGKEDDDQDFMDVMLSILEESKLGNDVDTINKTACLAIILGGADTTWATLTWALSLLLNNPNALKKAQDELDLHVGRDRNVDESDLVKLTYIDAIIKETLRLYPPGPLLGPRVVTEDCTIAGYHVRAGTRLIVNAWKIQRDPLVWSQPHEYQPERFLERDVDMKGQHFELIPFGSGRRACPAISLALQVLPLTLAHILHGFELRTPNQNKVDMTETPGIVHAKATPLEVLVAPRISPKCFV